MEVDWASPPERLTLAQYEAAKWEIFRGNLDAWRALQDDPTYRVAREERVSELRKLLEELRAELGVLEGEGP